MARQAAGTSTSARTWLVRVLLSLLAVALVATAGASAYRWASQRPARVQVVVDSGDRRVTVLVEEGAPLIAALVEAQVVPRDGRLLSAGTGAVIDPIYDPAQLTVDGKPARPADRLAGGERVLVNDGVDRVEDSEPRLTTLQPPALPAILRRVHVLGTPGSARSVVGVDSGEVVSTEVVKEPVAPRAAQGKVVALTFDDGPTAEWTPAVLAILRQKGVKATFCQVGENVERQPDLVRQVVADGHRLCNHTQGHDEAMRGAAPAVLDQQILGGRDAITSLGFEPPEWFRPPGGFLDDAIEAKAHESGEAVVMWTVDTEDWRHGANFLTILDKVFRQVEPGAIVLMHDGGGKDRSATVATLGPMIDLLRAQGYSFTFPTVTPGSPTY